MTKTELRQTARRYRQMAAEAARLVTLNPQNADLWKSDVATARAVGQDAGNRNARKNGRTVWNEDDWNAAAAEMALCLAWIPAVEVAR